MNYETAEKENGPLFRFYSTLESCTGVQPSAKDWCRSEPAFGCSCTSFHRRKMKQYTVVGEHILSLCFRPALPKLKPAVKVRLPADVCRDVHLLSSLCEQMGQILHLWDLDAVWRDQGRCGSQHLGLLKEGKGECVSKTLPVGSAGTPAAAGDWRWITPADLSSPPTENVWDSEEAVPQSRLLAPCYGELWGPLVTVGFYGFSP